MVGRNKDIWREGLCQVMKKDNNGKYRKRSWEGRKRKGEMRYREGREY